ncbi:MAG: peptide chain release factor N(5)-glutamine methyltransferase [Bacillota bacterium]|nr:peptide chain release factor N(5)-glutamine methyltransferase [Bacillota bacterium]
MPTSGKVWTIKDILNEGISRLKEANIETPVLEAGVLLCNLLNIDRAFLYSKGEQVLSDKNAKEYLNNLNKRINGLPLQYITGHQEFMSLDFQVTPKTLIPRQDTEILVETVINYAKNKHDSKLRILDIGTGSGCIAVSMAYFIDDCCVTALDISPGALKIAELNANNNGVGNKIIFKQVDIMNDNSFKIFIDEPFDIIVSNPPYIPAGEIPYLQKEVREFEPLEALDGGADGLDFYREIISKSNDLLPHGALAFEVGYDQAKDVYNLMKSKFSEVSIQKDLSGIDRVVMGFREFQKIPCSSFV